MIFLAAMFVLLAFTNLYLNISATFHVATTVVYNRTQKVVQLFLIWCIPVFGSLLAIAMLRGFVDVNSAKSYQLLARLLTPRFLYASPSLPSGVHRYSDSAPISTVDPTDFL